MSDTTITSMETAAAPALWLDGQPVSTSEVMAVLRKERKLPELVKNLVLDRTLSQVKLADGREDELLHNFRQQQKLESDEAFTDFLQNSHITEPLLKQSLSRPHRVVQFREERWGPRANSLYLKHKDRYDRISYRRLQSGNADVMQEVFFRLKDREDSWETMARQFPGAPPDADALLKGIPAAEMEAPLLAALRKADPGVVIRPLRLNPSAVVVAELESIEASRFDDELRTRILRQEFDSWLQEECERMLNKLQVPA